MKRIILFRTCQFLCILTFFFLLTHSTLVLYYAKKGLSSWAYSVLPVLLPFIILSKFWIYYDIPQLLFQTSKKILPKHSRIALSTTILILGISSGFPIGAIFVKYFFEKGIISKRMSEELLPLCSFISPMFLIGYIHPLTGYHGTLWIGFVLALYIPIFLLFFKTFLNKKEPFSYPHATDPNFSLENNQNKKSSIRDIWLSSLEIIFTIGIYMMLFSILFGLILDEFSQEYIIIEIVLSNLEITTGIFWLSHIDSLQGIARGVCMAGTIAFGGLCTAAQVYSIIANTVLSMQKYLYKKGLCAILSALLFYIIQMLCF